MIICKKSSKFVVYSFVITKTIFFQCDVFFGNLLLLIQTKLYEGQMICPISTTTATSFSALCLINRIRSQPIDACDIQEIIMHEFSGHSILSQPDCLCVIHQLKLIIHPNHTAYQYELTMKVFSIRDLSTFFSFQRYTTHTDECQNAVKELFYYLRHKYTKYTLARFQDETFLAANYLHTPFVIKWDWLKKWMKKAEKIFVKKMKHIWAQVSDEKSPNL
jgi:hypothetical protein